jgi:hypothetical protein
MALIGKRIAAAVLAVTVGTALAACGTRPGTASGTSGSQPSPTTAAEGSSTAANPTTAGSTTPAGGPPPTTTSAEAAPAPPGGGNTRCSAAVLRGRMEPGDPGAGQRHARLVVTNTGPAPCTLYGYGGLQLLDRGGRPLPTDLIRQATPGPALVRLAPGASAAKNLHWTIVPSENEPTDRQCEPPAATISVIPPDERQPFQVSWSLGEVCGHGRIDGSAYYPA